MSAYAVGDRVALVRTTDPYTRLEPGTLGTVRLTDSLGTIFVSWDDGSSLGIVLEAGDAVRLVPRIVRSESGAPIDEADDWVCDCGNVPSSDGFYPSDADGTELEPLLDGPWDTYSYVCARCTRIIDARYGTELRGPGPVRWLP